MTAELEFHEQFVRARSGDALARSWLVERYVTDLTLFVQARSGRDVRKRQAPEDLAQEALLTFLRRLETFPEDLSEPDLKARLFQIAKWAIAGTLGDRHMVREASFGASGRTGFLVDPPTPSVSRGTVTHADDHQHLAGLIERLDAPHAEVIRHVVVEGRSAAETARLCGIAEEAVNKRLQRARAKLLTLAARWGEEERRGRGAPPE